MVGFDNPLAPKANRLQAKSAEIKRWVRDVMELPPDTPVTVAELACRDRACPEIETVIGVMEPGRPIGTARIHRPMRDISWNDVVAAVARMSYPPAGPA